jgi:hypothetical protein
MRRVWAILATASLVAAWGCGNSYDIRLNKTLEDMKYRKRLDDNLTKAADGKFQELLIFVRPPKNLQAAKEFLLPLPEPGKFDLESSFLETKSGDSQPQPAEPQNPNEPAKPADNLKQSLHVLARVKRPKSPNAKKKAEPVVANRGDFNRDVLALLNAAYTPPTELTIDKFKEVTKGQGGRATNRFKHHAFTVNDKNVQVYLYGPKGDPNEVALVFEYPRTEQLYSKIELCLEAFAAGNRAKRSFSGAVGEEQGDAGAAAPGVF